MAPPGGHELVTQAVGFRLTGNETDTRVLQEQVTSIYWSSGHQRQYEINIDPMNVNMTSQWNRKQRMKRYNWLWLTDARSSLLLRECCLHQFIHHITHTWGETQRPVRAVGHQQQLWTTAHKVTLALSLLKQANVNRTCMNLTLLQLWASLWEIVNEIHVLWWERTVTVLTNDGQHHRWSVEQSISTASFQVDRHPVILLQRENTHSSDLCNGKNSLSNTK